MSSRRIAYVTGSRADFGLMQPILDAIRNHPELLLDVLVAGEHFSDIHARSVDEVMRAYPDAIQLDAPLRGDKHEHHARYLAELHTALTERFIEVRPDAILVLGDRGEQLIAALVGTYLRIPVIHQHGGELSSTLDNAARFAVSRLAHFHTPALASAATRLRVTGEHPDRIRVMGAPSLDRIHNMQWPSRAELFTRLGLDPARELIFVTQHSTTETSEQAGEEMRIVLEAVGRLNRQVLAVNPHLDPGGTKMVDVFNEFRTRPGYHFRANLGHADFLSVARESALWIGNSSAGVIESASLGVPVINLGTRQSGRERGANVLDAALEIEAIVAAADFALRDQAFRAIVAKRESPWGDGKTGERVANLLAELDLAELVNKAFDFPV